MKLRKYNLRSTMGSLSSQEQRSKRIYFVLFFVDPFSSRGSNLRPILCFTTPDTTHLPTVSGGYSILVPSIGDDEHTLLKRPYFNAHTLRPIPCRLYRSVQTFEIEKDGTAATERVCYSTHSALVHRFSCSQLHVKTGMSFTVLN